MIAFLDRRLSPRVDVKPLGSIHLDATRTGVVAQVMEWADDVDFDKSARLLLITGIPGSGKSSIATSAAKQLNDAGHLWARFFFNRDGANTTDANVVFPSIAWQLHTKSSDVAHLLFTSLVHQGQPSIAKFLDQAQINKLFIEPLQVASKLHPTQPVVVLLDALDECNRNQLHYLAELLAAAITGLSPNTKILITCRADDDIILPFSSLLKDGLAQHIHLDTESSVEDVPDRRLSPVSEDYRTMSPKETRYS